MQGVNNNELFTDQLAHIKTATDNRIGMGLRTYLFNEPHFFK